jgi:hypothetical protein
VADPSTPGFIQVAVDGAGKRMRMVLDHVQQPDGSVLDVYTEVVIAPPEWQESTRDAYMRRLAEDTLIATQQMVIQLAAMSGPRSSMGGNLP